MKPEQLDLDLGELGDNSAPQKCEWQECEEDAVGVRDTPWGDLLVCRKHADEPLFDENDP